MGIKARVGSKPSKVTKVRSYPDTSGARRGRIALASKARRQRHIPSHTDNVDIRSLVLKTKGSNPSVPTKCLDSVEESYPGTLQWAARTKVRFL